MNRSGLNTPSGTLHPAPYTVHPPSSILHPPTCTLDPQPGVRVSHLHLVRQKRTFLSLGYGPEAGPLVSSFEVRVSGFEFRILGIRFRVSGFEFRFSTFGFSGFGFQVLGFGFRVSGFGFWFLGGKDTFIWFDTLRTSPWTALSCSVCIFSFTFVSFLFSYSTLMIFDVPSFISCTIDSYFSVN